MSVKTLAIAITCHGNVPIEYEHEKPAKEILARTAFQFKHFNIQNLTTVTLAKLGGVCFANKNNNNIEKYVSTIISKKDKLYDKENVKNTDDLIQYLYNNKSQLTEIRQINDAYFSISYPPKITVLDNFTLEKMYTPLYKSDKTPYGGVAYLSSDGFTGKEIDEIKKKLKDCNDVLYKHGLLYKSQIFQELQPLGIDNLYFIDLTCFAYTNMKNVGLTEADANWLNSILEKDGVYGGNIVKKNKSKGKRKGKSKKSKRNIKINRKTRKT